MTAVWRVQSKGPVYRINGFFLMDVLGQKITFDKRLVSQKERGCSPPSTDFKSSKNPWIYWIFFRFFGFFGFFFRFFGFFGFFSGMFWVYEDFLNKKGFKHCNRGVVHSQIRCTDFYSSRKIHGFLWGFLGFSGFFEICCWCTRVS